jgi:hypothetical protein
MSADYYTDAEVAELCEGLTQPAAMVRYLRSLGLKVDRKPNGKPLAWRPLANAPQAQNGPAPAGLNSAGLVLKFQGGRRGPQAQRR